MHPKDCECESCTRAFDIRSKARTALVELGTDHPRFDLVEFGQEPPIEYSLIAQLATAAGHSSGNGNVGRSRAGVPFDVVALELFESVEKDLCWASVIAGVVSVKDPPNVLRSAFWLLEKLDSLDVDWLEVQGQAWSFWAQRIRDYLVPARRTPIPGCCPNPECGQWTWFGFDDEGQVISDHALRATWRDGQVDGVECACCFSFTPRRDLMVLAQSLDAGLLLRLQGGSV